jgi:hypothetical protein
MKKSPVLSLCLLIVTLTTYAFSLPVTDVLMGGDPDENASFPRL